MILGVFFLILTGLWEHFTHNLYNIFPHALMQNFRGFTIITGVTFLVGMLYYSTLILWPLQVGLFYTSDSTTIGLYSMAFSLGGYIGAILTGFLLSRFNKARWILTGICVCATAIGGAQAIVGKSCHEGGFFQGPETSHSFSRLTYISQESTRILRLPYWWF